jgi:hypothetical protein
MDQQALAQFAAGVAAKVTEVQDWVSVFEGLRASEAKADL